MPLVIDVDGLNPTSFSRSSISANVVGTSPACIGKKIFFALEPHARSIAAMKSRKVTGLLFPIL